MMKVKTRPVENISNDRSGMRAFSEARKCLCTTSRCFERFLLGWDCRVKGYLHRIHFFELF